LDVRYIVKSGGNDIMGGESREFSGYLSQIMNRKSTFAAYTILTMLLLHLSSGVIQGNDQNIFVLKKDGKIDARIENRPLNQTLRDLATKLSIDLKGASVGSETVNLSLSEVSLEELLKKMMRGYNYVLVKPDKSDRLMLMVLSRADRTAYVPPSPQPVSAPPPVPQPVPQAVPVTPPRPQQAQSPSMTPTRPGSGVAGLGSGAAGPQSVFPSGSPQGNPMTPPMPSPVADLPSDMYPPMPPGFAVGGGTGTGLATNSGTGSILGSGTARGTGGSSSGGTGSSTTGGSGSTLSGGTGSGSTLSGGTGSGTLTPPAIPADPGPPPQIPNIPNN
jgi:hypothetical protein